MTVDNLKHVYIAGPFNGPDARAVELNVRRAEELAYRVAELGAVAVCVHAENRFRAGTLTEAYWVAAVMSKLRRCDAIMMEASWAKSPGAQREFDEACVLGKRAFFEDANGLGLLKEWLAEPPEPVRRGSALTTYDWPHSNFRNAWRWV
jgi:hypothetical protein